MKPTTLFILLCLSPLSSFAEEAILQLNGERFLVTMAITKEEQKKGLMHTQTLPQNHGLLFVYPEPSPLAFWMKDTLIALDILFFDAEGQLINSHLNVQPCTKDPCPSYNSKQPAQYVLEINAGTANKLRLAPGDQFHIIQP